MALFLTTLLLPETCSRLPLNGFWTIKDLAEEHLAKALHLVRVYAFPIMPFVCLKAPTFRRFFFDNFHMSQEEAVDSGSSGSGSSSSTVVLYSSLNRQYSSTRFRLLLLY